MPSNTVTIQVGQCGNQLGMAFWERMSAEHGITLEGKVERDDCKGEDCKEIFFNEANCGEKWVPRAVLVDLEPRVINEINSDLFDLDNIYQSPTGGGAGNNWAKGFNQGGDVTENIMEIIEHETERADNLENFALCHSILGGTGSGLGSRLLQEIRDRYPKKIIQTYSAVQLMTCNVHVAPYNIVLSLDAIMEHADMCLLFDNDAFERYCKSVQSVYRLRRDVTSENSLSTLAAAERKNYAQINSMMSQVMTGLSAPMRFYSPMYPRFAHISMMLNPFPPMIFSQPAIVPFVPVREDSQPKPQLIKFPEPKNVISHLLDPRQLISSSKLLAKKQRGNELKRSASITSEVSNPSAHALQNVNEDESQHKLLSGLIILQSRESDPAINFAGSVAAGGQSIGSLYDHIRMKNLTLKNIYKSPAWMPGTLNLTSCRLSPYMNCNQNPVTGLLLANHTSIVDCLGSVAGDFDKMWKKKANVHNFESALEIGGDKSSGKRCLEERMDCSKEKLENLINLYKSADSGSFMDVDFAQLQDSVSTISCKESPMC